MATEDLSPRYVDLDAWGDGDVLKAFLEGQLAAVAAVGPALPAIAAAASASVAGLRRGGRLVYVGAGTSGRIGVQDGAELTPTFDWPKGRLAFAIAGGDGALLEAVENAEDSAEDGVARMTEAGIGPDDVVVGIAASGTTPYTVAAVRAAAERGSITIGIANNPGTPLLAASAHPVLVETGEEAIAGSTRMKAGTAQKVVLNLFSSLVMIRLGRVYRGEMVHMRATNAKLRRRSEVMIARLTGCGADEAARALAEAEGDLKLAVILVSGVPRQRAEAVLARSGGNLRAAMAEIASHG
ncbi:N-acetylmuramic acid 6-phosphate etherase [Arenibaculum sp.]|jgi:N-acetylmuramic acid 6-phosphate etherase|uniref:N-acetylmuramic acid 6-phosphate etherase n=1 Tax=Arenibaculum sp. TaxID=2865862 RepID=UPI002E0D4382|nr:N-acetylmuramic acid 6-phosphate etherase [Arenibaculum sp.]